MISREQLFEKLFLSFRVSLAYPKSEMPRQYLKNLGLDWNNLQIGFNSGQFHHRQSNEFKKPYIEHGILSRSTFANVKAPHLIPYKSFGSYGIIFPLKDHQGNICNFFAKRIKLDNKKEEFLNDEGLYPAFPSVLTKRLYLLPDILETASFLQAGVLDNKEAVLALRYGEKQAQHIQVINSLHYLEEIITIK